MYAQEEPLKGGKNLPSTQRTNRRRAQRKIFQTKIDRRPSGTALPLSETGQRLAALFPNGWDWIHSPATDDRQKPDWETIKRYPLTPIELWSLHQDPEHIIGVRPSTNTRWGIIDLDRHSPHHPAQNPKAIETILNTLEDIGITRTLINQSSHSGGLHLYIPLPEAINSFNFSITLKYHLEAAGIQIRSGQCEIFPNPKRYISQGKGFSHYNGIRLPFQPHTGFIPLDSDLTPLCWSLETWLDAFDIAAAHQDIAHLKRQIEDAKQNRRIRRHRDPHSIATWQERIEQEKAQGWTGPGQTNEKLKAIACEARVFLGMDSPQQIAQYIQQTAQSTPGFHQHSNHTHDIERRSQEIATWSMRYYWPLGTPATRSTEYHSPPTPIADFSYHQAKREAAQYRIKAAIAELQSKGPLAATATERANDIIKLGKVGKKTLYRPINKPLWHPAYIPTPELAITLPTETIAPEIPNEPPNPPTVKTAETQTEQESFQLEAKTEKTATPQTLNPLLNKTCSQLYRYVGFVITYLLLEAAVVLPPTKGQGPTIAAIPTVNPLERGVQGGETALDPEDNSFLRGFGSLKQSLPESFQAKLTQHERQRERDRQREQNRLARLQARQVGTTPTAHNNPKNLYSPQPPYLWPTPPIFADQSEPQQRPPRADETSEFETWYALAERFKLVSDFYWADGEYWVEQKDEWYPYAELAGTFPVGYLQRHLRDRPQPN